MTLPPKIVANPPPPLLNNDRSLNFARLLFYYQGFVLFHVSVVRNVVMLKMKLHF